MNIHGHKLRIAKIKEELKKGKKDLGEYKFNLLTRRKLMHNHIISNLRKEKKKRERKRK